MFFGFHSKQQISFLLSSLFFSFIFFPGSIFARVNSPDFSTQEDYDSSNLGAFQKKMEKKLFNEEKVLPGGFIALSLAVRGEFGLHKSINSSGVTKANHPSIFSIGLLAEGASPDYKIESRITILHDAIHVADYFTGKSDSFTNNQLYSYSFFNLAATYRVAGKKNFFLHLGFALGHQGFLHQNLDKPAYSIYPAFSIGLRWFISKKVLFRLHSEILIPLVNVNAKAIFYQTNRIEFVFPTKGDIRAPSSHSVLLVLQVENINTRITFKDKEPLQKYTAVPSFRVLYVF